MRSASFVAFAAVIVSGLGHLAFQFAPRPWSALGHIDIAALLTVTPIFSTHWPYWTFPFEYHPVIGWGSAILSYIAGELVLVVIAWIVIMALCAREAARALEKRVGPRRTLIFWSLAPQLVVFSGQNFDVLVVLTLLAATAALRAERPIRAGVALAIGAATKLVPLVGLPPHAIALWRSGSRRTAVLLGLATAGALVAIDLPAIVAPYSLLRYGVSPYGVSTWNLDSIWFPVAVVLDPFMAPSAADAVISLVSIAGLGLTYAVVVLRPAWRGAEPERLLWLGIAVVLLWTRLRSPQYAIWLLPLFALYVPDVRLLLFMFLGDVVSYVTIFLLKGIPRDPFAAETLPFYAVIVFGVVIRQVAVVLLLVRARRAAPAGPAP